MPFEDHIDFCGVSGEESRMWNLQGRGSLANFLFTVLVLQAEVG